MTGPTRAPSSTPSSTPSPGGLPERPGRPERPEVRRRGFVEVRWRQFRRAPKPVFRAVMSSLSVAVVLGVAFLAYDLALDRGAQLPGGDLRLAFLTVYVLAVLVVGSVVTYFVVPLPSGPGGARRTRSRWSLALGLFAAVPIAYLVLVVLHEIVKPLIA